ncbi:xylose isomerase-like protein [Phialemonium atrogriseum]|uniref:Xylose isomerase-like protein n=1 Tax=Phialemonium atrogriseum TaxID=1093897 RepID=A0AAJ0BSB4_9PEZI|nr:xylose isomerase-like protein [Phialemonium atrogriseum]KAK1763142.1 xylose isomerase-like protein [Phialemonium atrogriseum]
MALPYSNVPLSMASCSIGLPRHSLHQKIEALSQAGFGSIELSFPDLQTFASSHFGRDIAADDYDSLCLAAAQARHLCDRHGLDIAVLQPFSNFEGWPRGSPRRDEALARARGWVRIMDAADAGILQVGSTDSVGIDGSVGTLAADLAELADMLAPAGRRLAYENWCWATRAPAWRDVWEIVREADRPNIGLCLDTFQSAGGEWGDPTTESGRIETGGVTEAELDLSYRISLQELARTVPADKIYFLQVSDAYYVSPPMKDEPDESGLRPRGRWSHDYRPLPYDGGYLPIVPFVEAVLATGFRGLFSIEVFDGRFEQKYGDNLFWFARKAKETHQRLLREVNEKRVLTGLE